MQAAYDEGRRAGLAAAALALSIVAFVNLLGMEKSILAAVLALVALRGAIPGAALRRRARVALAFALVHVITVVTLVVHFRDKFGELLRLLHKLS